MALQLSTLNPWSELDRWFGSPWRGAGNFPPVNIWLGDDDAVLLAEVPGIDPNQLNITVKDDAVSIRGTREVPVSDDQATYLRQERSSGAFTRSFTLPFKVDADRVSADYRRGVLELRLPRSPEDKPRKISVKAS